MNNLFNMDNPVFRALGKVMDLIILNLICIVCCIPIVTIGPSLTALFYVTLKMVRNEEGYIVKSFFKSFRQNLRQGIVINLIMLALAFFLFMDFRVLNMMETRHNVLFFLLLFVLLIYMMVFIYIYPVLAKFDNTVKNTFQNALMMSLSHLPYTFLMLVVTIAPFALLFFTQIAQIQSIILMLIFLMGVAVIAYSNSYFFVKIFDKYVPAEEPVTDTFAAGSEAVNPAAAEVTPVDFLTDPTVSDTSDVTETVVADASAQTVSQSESSETSNNQTVPNAASTDEPS